jgi:folate-binding protein YgfZ
MTHLSDRAVLTITGEDRFSFLQGLITNDIEKLKNEPVIYTALLSPQGKYLFDFFIIAQGEQFLIDCEAARAEELRKRLSMYKLRAKVTIKATPEYAVLMDAEDTLLVYQDPRHKELGIRAIAKSDEIKCAESVEPYHQKRYALGIPEGSPDFIVDRSLIPEFGFEDLNGIDFTKGCYVGQEIIARMKYRANLRKFIHSLSANTTLPDAGTPIMSEGKNVGEIRAVNGNMGIGLIRLEATPNFTADNVDITATIPSWASPPSQNEEAS